MLVCTCLVIGVMMNKHLIEFCILLDVALGFAVLYGDEIAILGFYSYILFDKHNTIHMNMYKRKWFITLVDIIWLVHLRYIWGIRIS